MTYESVQDLSTKPYAIKCDNSSNLTHYHTSIELIYVIDGQVVFSVDGKTQILKKDDMAFVNSCQTHSSQPSPSCTIINVVVQQNFLMDFNSTVKNRIPPPFLTDSLFNQTIRPLLDGLIDANDQNNDLIVKGYINLVLGKIINHYGRSSSFGKFSEQKITDIIDYIDKNYSSPITLDSIAAHFHYDKFYFSKMFNKYLNCSLSTYVGIVRVQKVKEKMRSSKERPIIDVAFDCGFNSLSTFYRYQKLAKTRHADMQAK